MKFVVGENGRNPVKNLPRPRFVHHETHMEGPRRKLGTPAVGGERLTACATRLPIFQKCLLNTISEVRNKDWSVLVQYYGIIIRAFYPKGRSFTANSGTKAAVLPKGRSSIANSGTKIAVLLGMNRCGTGSFPLVSASHSLQHLNRP